MVTRRLLQILKNNLIFASNVNRQYDSQFAVAGAKIGNTLSIRIPASFAVHDGATFTAQDYIEETVALVVDQQKHIDVQFTSVEMTLSLDDWSRRIGEPSGIKLANTVDQAGLARYWEVANSVMSPAPGATSNKWFAYLKAGAILDQEGTPRDNMRMICLEPMEQAYVVDQNKGLFQSATQIRDQYEEGTMGLSAGFKWAMDQNVAVHLSGARGGAPVVGAAGQSGSSLAVTGFTAAAAPRLKRGDIFQITGVNAVNPQSGVSTGRLRDFTVTADVSSAADGSATIPLSPAIRLATATDPRGTVDVLPAGAAPLLFEVDGTAYDASTLYAQNIAYHQNAFTLAMVDLVQPASGTYARASDPDLGISIRVWKDSNINSDTHPCRADILYGWKTIRPQMACRVWSAMS
jgi:hypothetical protein